MRGRAGRRTSRRVTLLYADGVVSQGGSGYAGIAIDAPPCISSALLYAWSCANGSPGIPEHGSLGCVLLIRKLRALATCPMGDSTLKPTGMGNVSLQSSQSLSRPSSSVVELRLSADGSITFVKGSTGEADISHAGTPRALVIGVRAAGRGRGRSALPCGRGAGSWRRAVRRRRVRRLDVAVRLRIDRPRTVRTAPLTGLIGGGSAPDLVRGAVCCGWTVRRPRAQASASPRRAASRRPVCPLPQPCRRVAVGLTDQRPPPGHHERPSNQSDKQPKNPADRSGGTFSKG